MPHISNISASIFSDLRYVKAALASGTVPTYTNLEALRGPSSAAPVAIPNIRDFPAFGTPANVVNVPVYGQTVSQQIQGQSDPSDLTFNLNYVPSLHEGLHGLVKNDSDPYTFLLRLAPKALPAAPDADDVLSMFSFQASFASFEVTPSLSDSTQASLTLTLSSDFSGPFTTS